MESISFTTNTQSGKQNSIFFNMLSTITYCTGNRSSTWNWEDEMYMPRQSKRPRIVYWFQRTVVMLMLCKFWIFYLNWFFSFLIIIMQTSHTRWHYVSLWFATKKIWKWHLIFSDEKHFLRWYLKMPLDNTEISFLISPYCPLEKVHNGFNNSDRWLGIFI